MKTRRLHKLFADYFSLKMVLTVNLIHLIGMLIYTVASRLDYRYFGLHFNTAGGFWDVAALLLRFLLPTVLAFVFAFVFRWVDRRPKALRTAVRVVAFCAVAAAMIQSTVLTFIFTPTMPLASCTKNPANLGQYDEMVRQSLPSSNCPDLFRTLPEHAEDVDYSYWYIEIMDHEWKISVAYRLPEAEYKALRDESLALLEAMEDMTVTETATGATWDTVDYRQNLGRANTHLVFSYDDATCRVSCLLDCFRYDY